MTVAEKITDYLEQNRGKWIRASCLFDLIGVKHGSGSAALSVLHSDGVIQKRDARFSVGKAVEYSIAGEGAQ